MGSLKWSFALCAVSLSLLVASGCGDDGDSGSGGAGGAAGSNADAAAGSAGQSVGGSSGASGSGGSAGSSGGTAGSSGGTAGSSGGTAGSSGSAGAAGVAGASGSAGAAGAAACDLSTHACAGDTPLNWSGPIAFYEGTAAAPSCPGAYPTKVGDLHSDLVPGSASCGCSCSAASGVSGCTGQAKVYGVSNCFTLPAPGTVPKFAIAAGSCASTGVAWNAGKYWTDVPTPTSAGSCAPVENHSLPSPQWTSSARSCSGGSASGADCGSGKQCIPRAQDPYKLCVYQPGDVACPSALYSEKHVVYESFTNTRACSTCSCGAAQSTCGGSVTLFANDNTCNSAPTVSLTAGCKDIAAVVGIPAGHYIPSPSGTCAASTSTLSGEVTTNGATTFCCATN